MKRNMLTKGIICLLVFTAFGCRVRKPIAPVVVTSPRTTETKPAINKAELVKKISDKQVDFNTLLLKAKADLTINNNTNDVSMNIRMQKDKVIWVSASVAIIGEVGRVLITPDSIKILNKLQNSYIRKPFSYIYQFANKAVDFRTLQNLFIGNAVNGTLSESSTITVNGGQTQLKGDLGGLTFLLVFNENLNLIQNNLNDKSASQTLIVNYGDYQKAGNEEAPNAVSIKSTAASKSISIALQYNYFGINEPVEFPFTVPKRYTVKN